MTDGYGQSPQQQPPQQQPQQGQMVAQDQSGYYDDGFGYYGNTFRGMQSSDQAAQVRQALFVLESLSPETDFHRWLEMFSVILDAAPRIPGISKEDYRSLSRRFKDIVERAHSQGRKRVLASKCQTILLDMRLLVSVSETPAIGMSGVGAMITTNVKQDQTIRMPQQPATAPGFWPSFGRK